MRQPLGAFLFLVFFGPRFFEISDFLDDRMYLRRIEKPRISINKLVLALQGTNHAKECIITTKGNNLKD